MLPLDIENLIYKYALQLKHSKILDELLEKTKDFNKRCKDCKKPQFNFNINKNNNKITCQKCYTEGLRDDYILDMFDEYFL